MLQNREEEPDEQLLVAAAQQDPKRFAELYELHFERVYAFIVRRVRDRVESQDLTSEVFHNALANLGRYEWRGAPFAAWLYRIAANEIADHFQRAARDRIAPEASEPAYVGLEEVEQRTRLFRFVNRLPADQRRVIQMRFAEEKSIHDVARDLGRSEGAVKQLQFRALESLRERMRDANG